MSDPALGWLLNQIHTRAGERSLWCLDENDPAALKSAGSFHAPEDFQIISNRVDLAQSAQASNLKSAFSDFDFSAYPDQSLSQVFYRVSKEKPVVHHIINEAARILTPGGQLFLCGQKNEGAKTYIEKAAQRMGIRQKSQKEGSVYTAILERARDLGPALDDSDYTTPRRIVGTEGLTFYSKPGLFGWQKVDKGSEFLWDQARALMAERKPQSLLDLGCGYGYLGLMTREKSLKRRVMTDNNAAAVAMARYNAEFNGIDATVIADDCARSIDETFDVVLCNPPFHQGFSVSGELTHQFLQQARAHLAPGGIVLFVVNSFIPLGKVAANYFGQVELLKDNGSFSVFALRP
ncbi:methyltransferase [Marinimicrobium sp. C2-29]|uniref:methyltransferase n=1 Tax=Marinimicrobium sp. C2-29 TaxID=3139825 RepID=UPI00313A45EE